MAENRDKYIASSRKKNNTKKEKWLDEGFLKGIEERHKLKLKYLLPVGRYICKSIWKIRKEN